jgi:hypothetical protein
VTSQNNLAYEMLTAEFPEGEVKSFNQAKEGQKPRWLSYVPDETVMGRLDTVLGPGNWSVTVAPTPTPGVALVTLGIKWPDNDEWVHYSDFGYPTNGDRGEALKEAVSDGIRRTGRLVGVARYIYAGEIDAAPPVQRPAPQQYAQRPAAPPKPVDAPYDADDMQDVDGIPPGDESMCEQHGVPWAGSPGDHWHKKAEGGYCRHPHNTPRERSARR